jgi:phage terminase large subunit-like protein
MVHHVGNLGKLEDEMCTWIDGESSWSPNRMDAAVWGLTELMLKKSASWGIM